MVPCSTTPDCSGALRSLGGRWRRQLADAGGDLRPRPEPDTWSAIEYAAHSRDVTMLHAYGVKEALTRDEPTFPEITDDQLNAAASTYADADPQAVVDGLARQPSAWRKSPRTPGSTHGLGASPLAQLAATCAGCSSMHCTTPSTISATSTRAWPDCEPAEQAIPADPTGQRCPHRRTGSERSIPSVDVALAWIGLASVYDATRASGPGRDRPIGGRSSVSSAVQGGRNRQHGTGAPSVPLPPKWALGRHADTDTDASPWTGSPTRPQPRVSSTQTRHNPVSV